MFEIAIEKTIRFHNSAISSLGAAPLAFKNDTMSDAFSPRQLDILRLYIKGFTYQEIANKLGISKNGVRWNLDDMVEKGGFESRESLVATAIENKLMVTTLKDE